MDSLAMGLMEDKQVWSFPSISKAIESDRSVRANHYVDAEMKREISKRGSQHDPCKCNSLSLKQELAALQQAADLPSIEILINISKSAEKARI